TSQSGLIGFDYIFEPYFTGITHHYYYELIDGKFVNTWRKMPFEEWIRVSYRDMSIWDKVFGLGLLGSIIWLVIYASRSQSWANKKVIPFRSLLLLLFFGLMFWIFLLPIWQYAGGRIALGLLYFLITLGCAMLADRLLHFTWIRKAISLSIALVFLLAMKNTWNIEDRFDLLRVHYLFPPEFPQAEGKWIRIGRIDVLVAEGGVCWKGPIPCTFEIKEGLEMRGDKIEDGFRINGKIKKASSE
ncbi:MAG: hypothetical protein AAFU64_18740, partial [Bacteroidota bacterium]